MTDLFTLFSPSHYVELPQGVAGWAGWSGILGLVAFLLWRWRLYNKAWGKRSQMIFWGLLAGGIVLNLILYFPLPDNAALPPPLIPQEPTTPTVVVFSALAWVLAGGLLGPAPAAILALLTGLLRAWATNHSAFYPLEMALLATLFAAACNQRYRTFIYQLLRHPLAAAILLALLYPILYLITTLFSARGLLVNRLDYGLTHLGGAALSISIELGVASLMAEIFAAVRSGEWGRKTRLEPAPHERSLQTRFLYSMVPLALALVLLLMGGSWYIAGNTARNMLEGRMANVAQVAAQSVPYFLEAGQSLITQLAGDARLYNTSVDQLPAVLSQDIKTVPFFRQLIFLDGRGVPQAVYPKQNLSQSMLTLEEQMGVQLALTGVPVQFYSIAPVEKERAARVAFVAVVKDEKEALQGVLIGRADLANNPFTQPLLASLQEMGGEDGQGLLLDENQRILYHPLSAQLMSSYTGKTSDDKMFYEDTAPDGTRRLVYFQRAEGRPWSIVLQIPARRSQQIAIGIAAPLLFMILLLSVVTLIVLRLSLRVITASLQNLALEAGRISLGRLDHPLVIEGEDEVGQLRRAFEQMRASLKARLDELNRLLLVSQGVASSLEIEDAIKPVLDSALVTGACSARIVLTPTMVPELEGASTLPVGFGAGAAGELYRDLDEQILAFTRQQDRLVLNNPTRPRLLNFSSDTLRPEALLAVALRHENLYYGALWIAFDRAHLFTEEEVRFMVTLGGQAALAAANARLFLNAEIGRQRLAAILASSPDPVLVIDQRDRLLLANPAAWQVLSLGSEPGDGQPIEKIIVQKDLLDLLRSSAAEKQSAEISLPGGQVYLATATAVLAEGRRVGRVCVLKDITHFKELDALKSEFVSTVSHDLRSPLTLMRGYATMLEMVGSLNEQQVNYVRKIIGGVESMSRLVNNLLDLGRIEAGIGLQPEMVPVQDVIERVISALQLQATQKHIQINLDIQTLSVPLIEADQALLQQALHNLVENAIKYTRAEGRVSVRAYSTQERLIFEVSDTGSGIAPMDQPRLFEKFYRGAQQSAKEQRGTGLGLAIVKSIAERHGGQVWVESQLGKGSTFSLAIPLRQSQREG